MLTLSIVNPDVPTIVKGKLAEARGVFVPFCTCSVMPLVLGMVTVLVHVWVPVHVRDTISPAFAAAIAAFTATAEQSEGPTEMMPACTDVEVRKAYATNDASALAHRLHDL